LFWISVHYRAHIFPDRLVLRIKHIGKYSCRVVAAFPAKRCAFVFGGGADKALRDGDITFAENAVDRCLHFFFSEIPVNIRRAKVIISPNDIADIEPGIPQTRFIKQCAYDSGGE
jgi:hypothetical protein